MIYEKMKELWFQNIVNVMNDFKEYKAIICKGWIFQALEWDCNENWYIKQCIDTKKSMISIDNKFDNMNNSVELSLW